MSRAREPLLPGATIGVLGSGQLGRMLALAARPMGYRVHVLSPDSDTPAGRAADREVTADYLDEEAVRELASRVDAVTFEFENVPAEAAAVCAERVPVRPAHRVLHVAQNRLREKGFLSENGFPVTPFAAVHSVEELETAVGRLGVPAILKTAGWGYDGKGQARLGSVAEAREAWEALGTDEAVLEALVEFDLELSVVAARGVDGRVVCFDLFANHHERHILDVTRAPAPVPEATAREAVEIATGILEELDVVGVLCVELFWTSEGRLLVNELAPRPHNSGHLTVDAAVTSQFEQQLRAVAGLPLGDSRLHRPAAMANLLGDLWHDAPGGVPDWAALLAFPDVKLHLYGKDEARRGRKMGHVTAMADSVEAAAERVLAARRALLGES